MKRVIALILICLSFTSLWAAEGSGNIAYSYFSVGMGYGFNLPDFSKEAEPLQGMNISLDGGYLIQPAFNKPGFGIGAREDLIIKPSTHSEDTRITSHTLIGPSITIPLSTMLNGNILFGPAFSAIDKRAGGKSVFAMGPGLDVSIEVHAPSVPDFAFKAGIAVYGNFGITERIMGVSTIGYASFVVKVGGSLFLLYPLLLLSE